MFKGETILKRINNKFYELISTLEYSNDFISVTVCPGFHTDGASIPRYLWTIIGCPMNGKYVGSAIIHDGLYASQLTTRKEADKLFLEMLEKNGVNKLKRYVMYHGVNIFGGKRWASKHPHEIEKARKIVKIQRR